MTIKQAFGLLLCSLPFLWIFWEIFRDMGAIELVKVIAVVIGLCLTIGTGLWLILG